MGERGAVIGPAYGRVMWKSLATQVALGLLAALMLDGGIAARVVGVAVLIYWLCAAVILVRRPREPTALDLAVLDRGFWPVLFLAALRQFVG